MQTDCGHTRGCLHLLPGLVHIIQAIAPAKIAHGWFCRCLANSRRCNLVPRGHPIFPHTVQSHISLRAILDVSLCCAGPVIKPVNAAAAVAFCSASCFFLMRSLTKSSPLYLSEFGLQKQFIAWCPHLPQNASLKVHYPWNFSSPIAEAVSSFLLLPPLPFPLGLCDFSASVLIWSVASNSTAGAAFFAF